MLKIEPIPSEIKKPTKKELKLPKILPQPHAGLFAWIILGTVGAGKSSLLWSMINKKNGWFKGYFDKIVLWQSTLDSNKTWEDGCDAEVINEFDDSFLKSYYQQITEQQEKLREKKKKLHNYLFIFDDMICDNIVSKHKTSAIDKIFTTYRHANVSIIICSQQYKLLNKVTRVSNLSGMFVLKVNKKEIEEVADEHSGLLDEDEFITMYHKVMQDDRGYLFIDMKARPENRFRDTINDVIQIQEIEK